MPALRVATRGSPLALRQVEELAILLGRQGVEVLPVVVRTTGDRLPDEPLSTIGGQGVFVREVQAAVLDGRAEAALHSAKDLPPASPPGLGVACVPPRRDPRDVLVGSTLDDLPVGATVATGSPRRRAQLASLRPDLTFVELRGNMATRLDRVGRGPVSAVVTALAALERLSLTGRVSQVLSTAEVLPQVGQAALAVEARVDDAETLSAVARVDHQPSRRAVEAERAVLRGLGAGCWAPCGALATDGRGAVRVEAVLASGDGRVVVRSRAVGEDPEEAGAEALRALLDDHGGRDLL